MKPTIWKAGVRLSWNVGWFGHIQVEQNRGWKELGVASMMYFSNKLF